MEHCNGTHGKCNGSQPQMESQWKLKWEFPIKAIGCNSGHCNSGHCGICVLSIISIYIQIYKLKYMYMSDMSGLFLRFSFGRATRVYIRIASRDHALSEEERLCEANLYARAIVRIMHNYAHVTVAHVRLQSPRTYADSVPCIRVYV